LLECGKRGPLPDAVAHAKATASRIAQNDMKMKK
jgi:hypothetical protein